MLSNERELAEIRSRLAALTERVVRLERKMMGRPLVEVLAEEEEDKFDWLDLQPLVFEQHDPLDAEEYLRRNSNCHTWLWKREDEE